MEFEIKMLINGDAFKEIKNIKDCSVDCCITDPPYFLDGLDKDLGNKKIKESVKRAGRIRSLPVGMKFDPNQGIELQKFSYSISKEIFRILKPGAFFLSFSQGRLYHRMCVGIEDAGFEIRDALVWKREGQAKAFSQDHFVRKMNLNEGKKEELIKTLNNRKTPQLKGQSELIILAQKPRDGTFINNWINYGVGLIDVTQSLDGKFPGTVIEVEKPKGKERRDTIHLTAKPILLMEHLIKIFTKECDIIFDPFMGSGTTGIASIKNKRRFIGFEINKEYYENAIERFKKLEIK
jgi:site-specific DNA-methyltransferase (adenine-specific)